MADKNTGKESREHHFRSKNKLLLLMIRKKNLILNQVNFTAIIWFQLSEMGYYVKEIVIK